MSISKHWDKAALFAGGVFFATAGFTALTSDCAKKVYTDCTAAVLRCKDFVMEKQAALKENCEDIYADAQDINEVKAARKSDKAYEEAKALVENYEACKGAEEKAEK